MKKMFLLLVAVVLALVVFTACRNDNEDDNDNNVTANGEVTTPPPAGNGETTGNQGEEDHILDIPEDLLPDHPLVLMEAALTQFPQYGDTGLPHVEGTIFQRGLLEATAWPGVVGGGGVFSMSAVDGLINDLLNGSLFAMNEFDQFGPGGIVTVEANMDARSITMSQHYDVYWHDGAPLTLYDLYFTYHVMAHPDHAGPRNFRSGNMPEIVGIWEYHDGEADRIEGLVLSNDNRTLTIYFNEFAPTIMYFGVWTSPMPAHLFGAFYPNNVAEMINSPYVRENPIGWGPFIFVNAEPGESYFLRRNENYVWGTPYIQYKMIRRISPDLSAPAMASGEFDMIFFRQLDYAYHMSPTNFRYFGSPNRVGQGHYAFRMGWWDFENHQNVSSMINEETGEYRVHDMMRPEAWYIRAAMAMAIDWPTIGQLRYHGLRFPAGAWIPIRHLPLMDLEVPMFAFNPAAANALLDEAGFTNRDSQGFRTWLDGEPMNLIWALAEDPTSEWYYQAMTQFWGDVGIRVSLWQGMFHDIWDIWDAMDFDADNDEVHFWSGAWNHGANPANSMWSREEFENASRHNSEELDAILARINSMAAWDMDYLMDAMSALQWYKYNNIFYFPTTWTVTLTALNNRVANWDTRVSTLTRDFGWHTVRLTAAQPY